MLLHYCFAHWDLKNVALSQRASLEIVYHHIPNIETERKLH